MFSDLVRADEERRLLLRKIEEAEAAKDELARMLATSESANALLQTKNRASASVRSELDASKTEARELGARLASLEARFSDLQREEAAVRGERDKLRGASAPVMSDRARYRSENVRLREELGDLRDAKALADAMQIRAAAAESLVEEQAGTILSLRKELAAAKRGLAKSLEMNKAAEARHMRNMASALSMIDTVVTESEKRVAETANDAGKLTAMVASMANVFKKDDAPPAADVPKEPSAHGVEQTRAAGILLCIAVMTQAASDVRDCFVSARRIPEELLTKSGAERRRKAFDGCLTSVKEFSGSVHRLCDAALGVPRGEKSPFSPEFITAMYGEMIAAAGREMFDPDAMERLERVIREMATSMTIGLRLAESATPSEAARAVYLPDAALHLSDLMSTVRTFEEDAPGVDDEALFHESMRKWQDNLALLVPWRATADRAFHLSRCRFAPF